MSTAATSEIAEVVQRVRSWPEPMRIALAQQILETVQGAPAGAGPHQLPRGPSAAEIATLFKTDRPAPDDTTVKQWIEEFRMEKYGR